MKFLDKVGLALFSIIVLILSIVICLISFGWVDIAIFSIVLNQALAIENGVYILVGILSVIILLAIKCLFFPSFEKSERKSDDDGILLQNENGKLLITKGTIKNLVTTVVTEFKEIEEAYSEVIINHTTNEVFVNLTVNVFKGIIIKDISSKLQKEIKNSVKKATDLEIKEINIKVNNIEPNTVFEEKKESNKPEE